VPGLEISFSVKIYGSSGLSVRAVLTGAHRGAPLIVDPVNQETSSLKILVVIESSC
jgi:hypothetical protein